ncbi:6-phosphogluconolactonase [Cecembia lonarensis]|uniref:N-acetylglucosamine-6-phosphate deacetylase n=1 Tax=Cecembia lonarensis (strain CCUG 58316 / KCTC 22772 / LW9) TaxID=1225176 RepID=K1LB02_CECL9|nr:6-phosphogluconolactonase [Cecembia lonarensis]EKB49442.1 N-acetylglucosamine-6-phosphate deacetylase [Cecembia lonarensis LW9]
MQVQVYQNRREMGEAAGGWIEKKILELVGLKDEIRIIFAAAPSQNEFLSYLRKSSIIPWEKVVAFHMDEYIGLEPSHPALFSNFLKAALFDHVPFKQVHLIDGDNSIEKECERYATILNEKGIDIVCMGIGENGHIAFNDPPVADFNDTKYVKEVELDEVCRQQQVNDGCFENLSTVPTYAITLTVPALLNAECICCVVPGPNKKEAVHQTLYGPVFESCPASILRGHWNCKLFTDKDALPQVDPWTAQEDIFAKDILTGKLCILDDQLGIRPTAIKILKNEKMQIPYCGPGLIDLQVNGVAGVDFNESGLTLGAVRKAVNALLKKGVTGFFPTLITNDPEIISQNLKIINQSCKDDALINSCILGIHLEGPFISPIEGAKGAHPDKHIQKPYWELVEKYQKASGGRIKLITLAPELQGAEALIKKCVQENILIAIGHSNASATEIDVATKAGASLSTHLGNAVPLMLPRHPNILWDQLANDALHTSLIADGFHLDPSFLKVVLKVKGEKAFLISDSTKFCGMEPGAYQSPIGEEIILEENGRLAMKHGKGLLAGAAMNLIEGVEYLVEKEFLELPEAWRMASEIPMSFAGLKPKNDWLIFKLENGSSLKIDKVFKQGVQFSIHS